MKRFFHYLAGLAAACAGLACAEPTAPTGEYRMVSVCTYTIGDAAPACDGRWERCWYTFADGTYHCPSGDYTPTKVNP